MALYSLIPLASRSMRIRARHVNEGGEKRSSQIHWPDIGRKVAV